MARKLLRYVIVSMFFLTIPIIFIHFVSAQSIPKEYSEEWPTVKKTAELVTIGYFKKEKTLDIVIKKLSLRKNIEHMRFTYSDMLLTIKNKRFLLL